MCLSSALIDIIHTSTVYVNSPRHIDEKRWEKVPPHSLFLSRDEGVFSFLFLSLDGRGQVRVKTYEPPHSISLPHSLFLSRDEGVFSFLFLSLDGRG
jgi:hypothetical protein